MRLVIATISAVLLWPVAVSAQNATPPWDAALTIGAFKGTSQLERSAAYGDRWWEDVEWRASVGRVWTTHFKTELDIATTAEGDRYVTRFSTTTPSRPYGSQELFQLTQASARLTWQFLENSWVHPYITGGVAVEAERKRTHVFDQYDYVPGSTRLIVRSYDIGPETTYRPAAVIGAGAKFYVSQRAFIKTGVQGSLSKRASSFSFLAGIGFDF